MEEEEKGGGLTPWTAASLLVLDSELGQALGARWLGTTFDKGLYARAANLISDIYDALGYSYAFRGTQGMISMTSIALILGEHATMKMSKVL